MKKNRLIILAVLVTIFAMLLTGCAGNTESKETTLSKIEMSTTETLPETETSVTKTETPETTTEEITKAETTKKQEYVPVETTKKATTTKAPETTKKQEPKPTQAPKPTEKPTQAEKVEPENEYVAELPTYPDGSIDFGAMHEDTEEELGGVVYF